MRLIVASGWPLRPHGRSETVQRKPPILLAPVSDRPTSCRNAFWPNVRPIRTGWRYAGYVLPRRPDRSIDTAPFRVPAEVPRLPSKSFEVCPVYPSNFGRFSVRFGTAPRPGAVAHGSPPDQPIAQNRLRLRSNSPLFGSGWLLP